MNKLLLLLAAPALATAALAQVDPAKPMVTGRGNVDARPGAIIVTNQTKADDPKALVSLSKFVVTGSLLRPVEKAAPPAKR
jgi:hypothetical protein